MSRTVNIVFSGSGPHLEFVECEDAKTGRSLSIGKWIDMPDGLCALQVRIMDGSVGHVWEGEPILPDPEPEPELVAADVTDIPVWKQLFVRHCVSCGKFHIPENGCETIEIGPGIFVAVDPVPDRRSKP
jgi:hypothetical protein